MKLSLIILKIVEKMDGQRSLNASLHILRGKRSGQTLQDVEYFSVKPYFSILPKLSESTFKESMNFLLMEQLVVEENGLAYVTQIGKETLRTSRSVFFDGWHYRGREELFFLRLLLLVQTLSQVRASRNSFLPITNDRAIQQFVKNIIRGQYGSHESNAISFGEELKTAIRKSQLTELQAKVLSHRLTGVDASGWTWEQIEVATNESRSSLQLEFLEAIHRLLRVTENSNMIHELPILHKLAEGIRIETPLTESTVLTKKLFDQGRTIDEISVVRQLKVSTIEDHISEMATNDDNFPISRFVSPEDQIVVRQEVLTKGVKRLRLLKQQFPHLSYFQLRLILSTTKGE